ncbi:MAG: hypothetical protein JW878_07215 [Methanomicrobia archaeon]|nr:hypothetical protein [Methanomicrobia archaeon]
MNPITPLIRWYVKVEGTPSGAVTSGKISHMPAYPPLLTLTSLSDTCGTVLTNVAMYAHELLSWS